MEPQLVSYMAPLSKSSKANLAVVDIENSVHVLEEDVTNDPELRSNVVLVTKTANASAISIVESKRGG
jgi:hypothetical protein